MKIVALMGKAQSGKTSVAKYLSGFYSDGFYIRLRFGEPLKNMLKFLGLSEKDVDGVHKSVPTDILCGNTPRYAMQTLGTEWGRNLIGEDIWIKYLERKMNDLYNSGCDKFVIDDLRFKNEAEWVKSKGGVIIKLVRNGIKSADNHISEIEQDDIVPDYIVNNDAALEELFDDIKFIIQLWYKETKYEQESK